MLLINFILTLFLSSQQTVTAFTIRSKTPTYISPDSTKRFPIPSIPIQLNQYECRAHRSLPRITSLKSSSVNTEVNQDFLDEIKSMRVKELKAELIQRNISIDDVFEKEELVKRLYNARINPDSTVSTPNQTSAESKSVSTSNKSDAIDVSLTFISLEGSSSVPAVNADNLYLRPSPGQFPAVEFQIPNTDKTITLLLDTACSGIVLRPSVAQKLQLPTYNTPVTMTAAGGTNMGGGVSQLPNLQLTTVQNGSHFIKGPFPAAIQDIGALPSKLDGIMGLSFLSQYQTVDFNFDQSILSLSKQQPKLDDNDPPNLDVVAEASMQLTNMGIYIVNVLLDGKGPVKMLVDTGAASTILNWKGVADMGLSRSSPSIITNNDQIGAMGADNVALSLTHSYILQRRFNFQQDTRKNTIGIRVQDNLSSGIKIDIGVLPVLDALQSYGVGGILGSDLLMKCDLLRLTNMNGPQAKVALYQK